MSATGCIPKIEFGLEPSPDGSAFELFRHNSAAVCTVSLPDGIRAEDFCFRSVLLQGPRDVIFQSQSTPQRVHRGADEIARGADQIFVVAQRSGRCECEVDGRRLSIGPGDVTVYDFTGGHRSEMTAFDMIGLMLDRKRMPPLALALGLNGVFFAAESGSAKLLQAMMTALLDVGQHLTPREAEAAFDGLAATVAGAALSLRATAGKDDDEDALRRMADFVDRSIASSQLNPDAIARHLALSRSALYRLCQPHGGVGATILRQCLDRSVKALLAGDSGSRSWRDIGKSHGFTSEG